MQLFSINCRPLVFLASDSEAWSPFFLPGENGLSRGHEERHHPGAADGHRGGKEGAVEGGGPQLPLRCQAGEHCCAAAQCQGSVPCWAPGTPATHHALLPASSLLSAALLQNNIAMLLEANYRERLLMVYNEVKKRLDYQVALQNLKRQKEQDHMIQWVEKSVVQSITPQQVLAGFYLLYVLARTKICYPSPHPGS